MKINHKSIGVFILSLLWLVSGLSAQNPQLLNYQGKLANKDGTPATGTFTIKFSIYSEAKGGKALWDESRDVAVTNGLFNVMLGSDQSLPDTLFTAAGNRYLGIKVGTESEMQPRFQLTSVPYAIHANSAANLSTPPIAARWSATNDRVQGPINFQWGTEVFNTNPNALSVTKDGMGIEVKKDGLYMVCMNVLQAGLSSGVRGDVHLKKNGNTLGSSLGYGGNGAEGQFYKHILNIIEFFKKGDVISVLCATHLTYAGSNAWSSLEIYKLN